MPMAQDKCHSNGHSPNVRNRTWDSPLPLPVIYCLGSFSSNRNPRYKTFGLGLQVRYYWVSPTGLGPWPVPQKLKVLFVLENFEIISCSFCFGDLLIIFVAHESNEILKLPVGSTFFPNLIARHTLFWKYSVCPFLFRSLASKIPC